MIALSLKTGQSFLKTPATKLNNYLTTTKTTDTFTATQLTQFGKAFTQTDFDTAYNKAQKVINDFESYKSKITNPAVTTIKIDPDVLESSAIGKLKSRYPNLDLETYARNQMVKAFKQAAIGSLSHTNIVSEYPTGTAAHVLFNNGTSEIKEINEFNLTTIDEVNRCAERRVMDEARTERMEASDLQTNSIKAQILSMAIMPLLFADSPDLQMHSPCFPCLQEFSADLKGSAYTPQHPLNSEEPHRSLDSVLSPDTIMFLLERKAKTSGQTSTDDTFVIHAKLLKNLLPMDIHPNGEKSFIKNTAQDLTEFRRIISVPEKEEFTEAVQQAIAKNWGTKDADIRKFKNDLSRLAYGTWQYHKQSYSRYAHKTTAGILIQKDNKIPFYKNIDKLHGRTEFYGSRFFVKGFWSIEPITAAAIGAQDYYSRTHKTLFKSKTAPYNAQTTPLSGAKLVTIWSETEDKVPTPMDLYNIVRLSGNQDIIVAKLTGGKGDETKLPTIKLYTFKERFPTLFVEGKHHTNGN